MKLDDRVEGRKEAPHGHEYTVERHGWHATPNACTLPARAEICSQQLKSGG
jgi:hypothetical protein